MLDVSDSDSDENLSDATFTLDDKDDNDDPDKIDFKNILDPDNDVDYNDLDKKFTDQVGIPQNKEKGKSSEQKPKIQNIDNLLTKYYPIYINDQSLLNHIKTRNAERVKHARHIFTEHERSIFNTIRKEMNDSDKGNKIREEIEKNRLFLENDYKNSLNEYQMEFLKANNFKVPIGSVSQQSVRSNASSKSRKKKVSGLSSRNKKSSARSKAKSEELENEVDLETTRTLNESDITGPSFSCRREDVPGELPIVPPSMRF